MPKSPPSPDEQPCDLRLLKQATYLQELVSIAAAASTSTLPPSLPQSSSSRPGMTFPVTVAGPNYVADIAAAAVAAAASASTSPSGSDYKSVQPPASHQSPLQRMKFGPPLSLDNIALAPSLPASLKLKIENTSIGGSGSGSSSLAGSGSIPCGSGWGPFTCPRCGNSYARPHSLNRHIRFECGVEPKFECPICHKKSKHKHNLVLHMRTHQNR